MAIFDSARDPRREPVEEFLRVGDKVKFRGMAVPAEILSGPHKSPGGDRWLIRKADGNVTLTAKRNLERIVPRVDRMAERLSRSFYSKPYATLAAVHRMHIDLAARQALAIADETREA